MSKKNATQSPISERMEIPKVAKDKHGNAVLLCPFCNPTHPLRADGPTSCGTIVRVQAVQTIYNGRFASKEIKCAKCGKVSRKMVQWQGNAFICAENCSPNLLAPEQPVEPSRFAGYVAKLPKWLRTQVEKYTGEVAKISETEPDGTRTGKIIGYAFFKGK